MKKILIEENAELANEYIQNIEHVYISRLNRLSHSIKCLGMGATTKELLIDAIGNNCENLNNAFNEFLDEKTKIPGEFEAIAPMLTGLQNSNRRNEYKKYENVLAIVSEFKQCDNRIYNGMRIDNPELFNWFELDENGKPYLLDSIKEVIREKLRKYTSTTVGAEMLKLQQSLAKDIQKMYDLMMSCYESNEVDLQPMANNVLGTRFPIGLFDVKVDRETGYKTFTPATINFDPEQIVVDEPFLDE